MNAKKVTLLSKDPVTIKKFIKEAQRHDAQVVPSAAAVPPLPAGPVLADADTFPADAKARSEFVAALCVHAANWPTACFGYLLSHAQRDTLAKAGVVVAHGPGLLLLQTLLSWTTLAPTPSVLVPDKK